MMLRMHFSKLLIICILFFAPVSPVFSEDWVNVDNNGQHIMLDTESIKYNEDTNSLYYNVKYYESKAKDYLIVSVQSTGNMAGVVSTCKNSDYVKNNSLADIDITKTSKSMKEITSSSLLYNADLLAKARIGNEKRDIVSKGQGGGNPRTENLNGKPGIDAIKEPDFGPFMRDLQRRIKKNWYPPKGKESKRVVLLFKIAKDGRLLSCSVLKSSGLPSVDQAAIRAVTITAPFRALPASFEGSSVNIEFTFDYNVMREN